jgi:hypothetical protein
MAKKSRKNLAKIAAGLGAAYALSKMGKGTMDGTEGDFPASSEVRWTDLWMEQKEHSQLPQNQKEEALKHLDKLNLKDKLELQR